MHVVIAINEATYADAIADFVNTQSWEKHTTVTIVSAVKPLKINSPMALLPGPILDQMLDSQLSSAKLLIENFVHRISGTISRTLILSKVEEGYPTDVILNEINTSNADLLICGSHGRHSAGRVFLGSVSHDLVAHAKCSVVVIKLTAGKHQSTITAAPRISPCRN